MSAQASPLADAPLWRRALRRLWRGVPGPIRRYLAERFGDVSKSEAWGYAVWSAMGVVVGVPEIWAAAAGSDFAWPTISTTVGHLQDRWPVVALVPVALIVMSAYSVFRVGAAEIALQADQRGLGRTPQGRLVKQEVSFQELAAGAVSTARRDEWPVVPYFALATAIVVIGAIVVAPSDNRFLVGYVLYSLIALFWVVIPNVAAYVFRKDVQFTTLFFTVRCLGRRLQFAAALVAALLVILLLHLAFYPWPSRR
jgi:hypothetical protein